MSRTRRAFIRLLFPGVVIAAISCACAGVDYPFRAVEMTNVAVRSGFWLPRIETNRLARIRSDFKRSEETGRIHNFEAAGRRDGKGLKIAGIDPLTVVILDGKPHDLTG